MPFSHRPSPPFGSHSDVNQLSLSETGMNKVTSLEKKKNVVTFKMVVTVKHRRNKLLCREDLNSTTLENCTGSSS